MFLQWCKNRENIEIQHGLELSTWTAYMGGGKCESSLCLFRQFQSKVMKVRSGAFYYYKSLSHHQYDYQGLHASNQLDCNMSPYFWTLLYLIVLEYQ